MGFHTELFYKYARCSGRRLGWFRGAFGVVSCGAYGKFFASVHVVVFCCLNGVRKAKLYTNCW